MHGDTSSDMHADKPTFGHHRAPRCWCRHARGGCAAFDGSAVPRAQRIREHQQLCCSGRRCDRRPIVEVISPADVLAARSSAAAFRRSARCHAPRAGVAQLLLGLIVTAAALLTGADRHGARASEGAFRGRCPGQRRRDEPGRVLLLAVAVCAVRTRAALGLRRRLGYRGGRFSLHGRRHGRAGPLRRLLAWALTCGRRPTTRSRR